METQKILLAASASQPRDLAFKDGNKVERYFITQIPALKGLLYWAEAEDFGSLEHIDEDLIAEAVGIKFSEEIGIKFP